MVTDTERKPRFRRSIEIQKLKEFMRGIKIGQIASRTSLSAQAGRNVKAGEAGYSSFAMARFQLEGEGIYFGCVSDCWDKGQLIEGGYKRLAHNEVVSLIQHDIGNIRSRGRRTTRKLANIQYDDLTEESQVLHNTAMTVSRTVETLTSDEVLRDIEKRVRSKSAPVPTKDVFIMIP